jgi:hypothetical protein
LSVFSKAAFEFSRCLFRSADREGKSVDDSIQAAGFRPIQYEAKGKTLEVPLSHRKSS